MQDIRTIQGKAKIKLEVNLWLLAIAFTLFTFIVTINPGLIRENVFLSLQITLAIPLLCSSMLARAKLCYSEKPGKWESYGFITYILAYGFLINVVGILLSILASIEMAIYFWVLNIISAVIYSTLEVTEDNEKISDRILKDGVFVVILLLLGILPALGAY